MRRIRISDEDSALFFPYPDEPVRIGSADDNGWVVPFKGVSRVHAQIKPDSEGLVLEDLGSKNGLYEGGERRSRSLLLLGRPVSMGSAEICLENVSTGDVELALELDAHSRVEHYRSRQATSTVSLRNAKGVAAGPAQALRLVREVAHKGLPKWGHPKLMAQAARALGALGLVEIEAVDARERILVRHTSSSEMLDLISSEEFERLIASNSGRGKDSTGLPQCGEVRVSIVPVQQEPRRYLAGFFAVSQPELMPWQFDFLRYLAELSAENEGESLPLEVTDSVDSVQLRTPEGMILGESPAIRGLLDHLKATIQSDLDVLLIGETGVGKELFARMVHASGPTREGPFTAINCAAIPADLLEAELFGVVPRAATGVDPRPGLFVRADGGTVFLDEVGEMSANLQAKLLRVVQEREVLAVGASSPKPIHVRLISASNRDLAAEVDAGRFRADLFYRLRGLQFHIPPLRERVSDLPEMALKFTQRAAAKYGKMILGISRAALSLLQDHDWPGNIRELEAEVERAVLLCQSGGGLERRHFGEIRWKRERGVTGEHPFEHYEAAASARPLEAARTLESSVVDQDMSLTSAYDARVSETIRPLSAQIEDVERSAIRAALKQTGGNKSAAARLLQITRNGLALKLKRLNIN